MGRYKDKEKERECWRRWYRNNREKSIAKSQRRRRKMLDILTEYKQSIGCEQCNETHPACLLFHHRDPNEKELMISQMPSYSLKRVMKEVKKCQVLCANCHAKLHWNEKINRGRESSPTGLRPRSERSSDVERD